MNYNIYTGDVMQWAADYDGEKFHALLCDPPYHLNTITQRFGGEDAAPAKGGVYARSSRGFMGKTWDGGDIAYQPELWAALGEHLYPGAFGMAFASSRGFHRMMVAIEDAGMILHPALFWLFGSGFPKSTRIDNKVEPDQPVVGDNPNHRPISGVNYEGVYAGGNTGSPDLTAPQTELGKAWTGHRYGRQALKPAAEIIVVFQKPYEGRPIDNIVSTGAGALNIDKGRIPTGEQWNGNNNEKPDTVTVYGNGLNHVSSASNPAGRWPAHIVLDPAAAAVLDRQSGESRSSGAAFQGKEGREKQSKNNMFDGYNKEWTSLPADSGGASRFFLTVHDQLEQNDPFLYTAKASRDEREAGLNVVAKQRDDSRNADQPSMNGGDGNPYNRGVEPRKNNHPTVKPIELTEWLAGLLLPPDLYAPRRLLVPFSGVGSEMIGAMRAGWDHIQGIEFTPEYVEIARQRLAYWNPENMPNDVQLPGGVVQKSLFD